LVVWLFGCLVIWLFGCLVVWLFGCLVIWLFGCLVIWLFGRLVVWSFGGWGAGCTRLKVIKKNASVSQKVTMFAVANTPPLTTGVKLGVKIRPLGF